MCKGYKMQKRFTLLTCAAAICATWLTPVHANSMSFTWTLDPAAQPQKRSALTANSKCDISSSDRSRTKPEEGIIIWGDLNRFELTDNLQDPPTVVAISVYNATEIVASLKDGGQVTSLATENPQHIPLTLAKIYFEIDPHEDTRVGGFLDWAWNSGHGTDLLDITNWQRLNYIDLTGDSFKNVESSVHLGLGAFLQTSKEYWDLLDTPEHSYSVTVVLTCVI